MRDLVTTAPVALQDTALRGRAAENLAAAEMWGDHPLVGVGPDNFELNYLSYSAAIGIDPRPEQRGAHNLYLESLAETGLFGALAFFAIIALALRGAWRARSRLGGRDALLGEALLAALGVYLLTALTLNSAFARYQWIFIGLALAAGPPGGEAGAMTAVIVFAASVALVAWVYAGYPLALVLLGRLRPRPRRREPRELPLSIIVAAHDEAGVIADKVANVLGPPTIPPSSSS